MKLKINIKNQTVTEEPLNKCSQCDNCYHDIYGNGLCLLDPKAVNAYGCDEGLLGNNAEPIPNYDYDDKDKYLDEFQRGGH